MQIGSVADSARNQIQEWIDTGKLKPGEQLKEEEIAKRLNISRPPIREAFKELESIGLVLRKPRRGVYVVEMTKIDMWEIYTLKANLYELAVQLAIPNVTAPHLTQIFLMCREMEVCAGRNPPDITGYQRAHHTYHKIILEVSGHRRLMQFASTLHQQVRRYSYLAFQEAGHIESSLKAHQKIAAAISEKQKKRACKLMRDHVHDGLAVLYRRFAPDAVFVEDPNCTEVGNDEKRYHVYTYTLQGER